MNAVAVRLALRIAAPRPVRRLTLAREGDAELPKLKDHLRRQWPSDATASPPRATLLRLTYIPLFSKRNRVHMLEFFNSTTGKKGESITEQAPGLIRTAPTDGKTSASDRM